MNKRDAFTRLLFVVALVILLAPITGIAQQEQAQSVETTLQGADQRVTTLQPLGHDDAADDAGNHSPVPGASKWGPSRTSAPPSSSIVSDPLQDKDPSQQKWSPLDELLKQARDNADASAAENESAPNKANKLDSPGSANTALSPGAGDISHQEKKPASTDVASARTRIRPVATEAEDTGWEHGKSAVHSPFSPAKPLPSFADVNRSELHRFNKPPETARRAKAKLREKPPAMFGKTSSTLSTGSASTKLAKKSSLPKQNGLPENNDSTGRQMGLQP
jgi:hypothetical protein